MPSRPHPPPGPKVCVHLEHGWFEPMIGLSLKPMREPQDTLEEIITNAFVSEDNSRDREFLSGLFESINKHRRITKGDAPSFHQFSCLPPKIRNRIWLFAIPSRTIHVSDNAQEQTCWNRRLPIPAPALACSEAWQIIGPLVYEVFNSTHVFTGDEDECSPEIRMERASWVTSADTLSVGGSAYCHLEPLFRSVCGQSERNSQ
ncbi:hypothetical protein CT0861_05480 [Colletotrichum tofieldiae]|uniref:2EXR domain-containing protein n=1 Tax=Colletotrichum tofieldiae TaxID=708197 RepID=A0A166Z6J4_9PEZI|nr:hypothetical protein CT0861_05480 [Colletotrichum tofieldiae]